MIGHLFAAACQAHREGRLERAGQGYQEVLTLEPDHADAWHLWGVLCHQCGHHEQAVDCYRRVIALRPAFAEARINLAAALTALGQAAEAVAVCRETLAINDCNPALYFNLALALTCADDLPGAIDTYRKALELDPRDPEAHNNLGILFKQTGQIHAAMDRFSQALDLAPDHVAAMGNLANCLADEDRHEEACRWLEKAIALAPLKADLHYNLGNCLKAAGLLEEALAAYERALALAPADARMRWNRSLALLAAGSFAEAWPGFEQRFAKPDWPTVYPFRHQLPLWDGKPFNGRLLVHDEQGFGDAIQFVRFLAPVKAMGMTVVLETRKPLIGLLATAAGVDTVVERPPDAPCGWDCTARVALLSLAGMLKTTLDTIPATVPYLRADRQKVDGWQRRLAGSGLKVGLVWAGNPAHGHDRYRSLSLAALTPLAMDGVRLIGLQKGPAAEQPGGEILEANLGGQLEDFTDTAALVGALDLIITVDTAVAHLAGALGRPVWVVLPALRTDWRWLQGRDDSPWYPTMRLWRQRVAGDWRQVVAAMANALKSALCLGNRPAFAPLQAGS